MSVYSLLGAPQLGQMHSRLIFALDVATVPEAVELVKLLRNEVGMFQVGKQLFLHAGPEVVREIKQHGGEVFLDLKFHDIPRTVAKAGAEATRLAVRMFDVHASGSVSMMRQTISEVGVPHRTPGAAEAAGGDGADQPRPRRFAASACAAGSRATSCVWRVWRARPAWTASSPRRTRCSASVRSAGANSSSLRPAFVRRAAPWTTRSA
jgi:hypothetical protein